MSIEKGDSIMKMVYKAKQKNESDYLKKKDQKLNTEEKCLSGKIFYIEEIERLNQIVKSKNEQIEIYKTQLESQEKLTNIIVHDMRNPSEAITNGLNQAKEVMKTDLLNIIENVRDEFKTYKRQIKDIQMRDKNLEKQSAIFQKERNVHNRSVQGSLDSVGNSQNHSSSQQKSAIFEVDVSILQKKDEQKQNRFLRTPLRNIREKDEESKKQDSLNFSIEGNSHHSLSRDQLNQIEQSQNERILAEIQRKEQQPQIEEQKMDYISQIQQILNLNDNLNGSNQDDQIDQGERNIDQQIIFGPLETFNMLLNNLQECNRITDDDRFFLEQQAPVQVQNSEVQQNQEHDNQADFDSDDLSEIKKEPEQIQANQNQIVIDRQFNLRESDLLVNLPRSINTKEGSKFLKRYVQKGNLNYVQEKEVIIFKENHVLKIDREIQTDAHQNDLKMQMKDLLMKALKQAEILSSNQLFMNSLQQMNVIQNQPMNNISNLGQQNQRNQRYLSRKQISIQSQQINMSHGNNQKKSLNKFVSPSLQSQVSVSKHSSFGIIKVKSISKNRQALFNSQNIDELQNRLKSQNDIRQTILKRQSNMNLIRSIPKTLQKSGSPQNQISLQCSQYQMCESQCKQCPINLRMILMLLNKLKQVLKITKKIEFYIDNSIASSVVISNLTEDLLTLAKLKNNKFELNIEQNVSIFDLVMEAFKVLSFSAEQKNISFRLEFEKSKAHILQKVDIDKRRIVQILINFISNSVKFTGQNGYIKVGLKIKSESILANSINQFDLTEYEERHKKKMKIDIIIEDNGAGISEENMEKLFSEFGKLNEHKQMNVKGTGLGLCVCKQIIDQMGGKVSLTSKVGLGTKFIISLEIYAQDSHNNYEIFQENANFLQCFNEIEQAKYEEIYMSSEKGKENNLKQIIGQKNLNSVQYQFIHTKQQMSMIGLSEGENEESISKFIKEIKKLMRYEEANRQNSQAISEYQSINEQILRNEGINQIEQDQKSIIYCINPNQFEEQKQQDQIPQADQQNQRVLLMNSMNFSFQSNNLQCSSDHSIECNIQLQQNPFQNQQAQDLESDNIHEEQEIDQEIIILQQQRENAQICQVGNNQSQENLLSINEDKEIIDVNSNSFQMSQMDSSNYKSMIKSKQSSINYRQKIFNNIEFLDHLNKNKQFKEVIELSMKYNKQNLQVLVANDDSYQLLFIETFLDQMKHISLHHQAQNGQIALDYVKNNVKREFDQEGGQENYYQAIFLDLEMPVMNGREACAAIQEYYYSFGKRSALVEQLKQMNQSKMNLCKEPQNQNLIFDDVEEWVVDLKRAYDIYQEMHRVKNQSLLLGQSKNSFDSQQEKVLEQVLKVFKILYQKVRYRSLKQLNRPFIFAYSAFVNQHVIDDTAKYGFDKCITAPLTQAKIDEIIAEFAEHYSLLLTKLMLEKLGPVTYFEQMIDFQYMKSKNRVSSFLMYNSILKSFEIQKGSDKQNQDENSLGSEYHRDNLEKEYFSNEEDKEKELSEVREIEEFKEGNSSPIQRREFSNHILKKKANILQKLEQLDDED